MEDSAWTTKKSAPFASVLAMNLTAAGVSVLPMNNKQIATGASASSASVKGVVDHACIVVAPVRKKTGNRADRMNMTTSKTTKG
jgi:hypothetical protein